jgi:tetratricopeptide (TPR) repeat protein
MNLYQQSFVVCYILLASGTLAQSDKALIRRGNEAFQKGDYAAAADFYNRSRNKNPDNPTAGFNLGAALYRMGHNDSVRAVLQEILRKKPSPDLAAKTWHNLGNTFLSERKPHEAIEAYKNALRLNPEDDDTRYNLAYAQRLIPPPQNQKQNPKNNKNNNDSQQNQQQNNPPQNTSSENHNKHQPAPSQMSREEAEKMLQALMNREKQNAQDRKEKSLRSVSPSGKDW